MFLKFRKKFTGYLITMHKTLKKYIDYCSVCIIYRKCECCLILMFMYFYDQILYE